MRDFKLKYSVSKSFADARSRTEDQTANPKLALLFNSIVHSAQF